MARPRDRDAVCRCRSIPGRARDRYRASCRRLDPGGRRRARPFHNHHGAAGDHGRKGAGAAGGPPDRALARTRSCIRCAGNRAMTLLQTITAATPSPPPAPGAGLFTSPFLLSYNQFENFLPTMQYEEKLPWLPAIGVTYHLGIDGPGLVMLLLSGLTGIASVLASLGIRERVRPYFALLLLAQASINGAIVARDMFVFLLFWGASIVPLALLIIGWGGPRRISAAWRLVGYWGLGTAALAVGALALYAAAGGRSFDMDTVLKASLSPRIQLGISMAMIVAAATRLPLFPLHGWVRDVLAEAPPGVVVAVAGAASRLGAFLLLRVLIGAEPAAAHLLSPVLAALAALTVGYAGLAALRAIDIRHAGAYLAMVPGAITVLGLAAVSPLGIAGSVLSLFTGGLAAALIAGVCATLAERAQARSVLVLGGLAPRMPNVAWLFTIAALALLGVPLLASFGTEVMTFFGAFKTQPIGAFAVAAGLGVTAVALAVLLARVLFGGPNPDAPGVSDASLGETWYLGLLAVINQMAAGISDMASPYVLQAPGPAAASR
ncbi:MAG: hypothetical protein E6I96_16100 [Chloroflexi bacterium]|nr:MAG: hypothetical protein E6I96_16100 [Chloroflexota bacterium]